MYLPGHLAMGYLVAAGPAVARRRPLDVRYALIPALIGSVTPDAIDKPLHALEWIDHSRAVGHSLFFLLLLYLIWRILRARDIDFARPFGWWTAGVASHFFADFSNDIFRGIEARGFFFSSWMGWPVVEFEALQIVWELGEHIQVHPTFTSLEIAVYALTLVVAMASRRYQKSPTFDSSNSPIEGN